MEEPNFVNSISESLKKAICWISETVEKHPGRTREQIISEAELRFNLSPREGEFLHANFSDIKNREFTARDK